jgi:hypothetical protein
VKTLDSGLTGKSDGQKSNLPSNSIRNTQQCDGNGTQVKKIFSKDTEELFFVSMVCRAF